MERSEVLSRLRKRALRFHRVLSEYGIYTKRLSESEFLERSDGLIEKTADHIVQRIGDPGANIVGLPAALLSCLSDALHTQTWDFEDGPEALFEKLTDLFRSSDYPFSWAFQATSMELEFQIGQARWSVQVTDLEQEELWLDALGFTEIFPRVNDYLRMQGWTLHTPATGDQTFRFVLMSLGAAAAVRDYLFLCLYEAHPDHDPRSDWLYMGVPVSELPETIWQP